MGRGRKREGRGRRRRKIPSRAFFTLPSLLPSFFLPVGHAIHRHTSRLLEHNLGSARGAGSGVKHGATAKYDSWLCTFLLGVHSLTSIVVPPNVFPSVPFPPGAAAAAMPLLRSFFISRDHIPLPLLAIDYLTYGGEADGKEGRGQQHRR